MRHAILLGIPFDQEDLDLLGDFIDGRAIDENRLLDLRDRLDTRTWLAIVNKAKWNEMQPVREMASFRINMAARAKEARLEKPRRLARARR